MNERIKELWGNSTGASVPGEGFYSSASKYNIEKFAELIVRECMDICYRTDTEYEGHKVKSTVIASKVAEHFGVEE
jgi:hypothetical protein